MATIALGQLLQRPVSIPISTKISDTISTEGLSLVGVSLPAALTSTTLTFLSSPTGLPGSFQPVSNSSGLVTYTAAPNEYIAINPADFYGIFFLQIQGNTNEAAARSLICSMKGM